MTSISNKDFIEFLKYYEKNPKFFNTITVISRPNKGKPLIENSFHMLSLDDICKHCSKFDEHNRPSTTDALWYNSNDEGKLVLYFIEFKWHNLDKEPSKRKLKDADVICKLRLKPFESIFIVLPMLFEDYCEKNNKEFTGLCNFLKNCEIKVFIFASTFSRENPSKSSKYNRSKIHLKNSRFTGPKGSIGGTVRMQYKRLELSHLIDFADIYESWVFDNFLKDEGLINQ